MSKGLRRSDDTEWHIGELAPTDRNAVLTIERSNGTELLNLYGKSIPARGIGAGLSAAEAGLRLRYEVRREFAPYVGVVWHREFGGTADFSREAGHDIGGWRLAAGVRTWF